MPVQPPDFPLLLESYRQRVERGIDELLPPVDTRPARLHEAMRYSLQAGGKRLRPVLLLATADAFGPRVKLRGSFQYSRQFATISATVAMP